MNNQGAKSKSWKDDLWLKVLKTLESWHTAIISRADNNYLF